VISFIVPAHNEQACLGDTLQAIHEAMRVVGQSYEIVVANDASTDATPEIAHKNNARVINVNHRQIAATRNAGARQARGDILCFVDADTLVNAATIQSVLRGVCAGAVGGGCWPQFEGSLPWWCRLTFLVGERMCRWVNVFPSGACLFCTRSAFQSVGGFDEKYYAWEELVFVRALKREGRFVIPAETVVTSGRKLRAHSMLAFIRLCTHLVLGGSRSREGLDYWYKTERDR